MIAAAKVLESDAWWIVRAFGCLHSVQVPSILSVLSAFGCAHSRLRDDLKDRAGHGSGDRVVVLTQEERKAHAILSVLSLVHAPCRQRWRNRSTPSKLDMGTRYSGTPLGVVSSCMVILPYH